MHAPYRLLLLLPAFGALTGGALADGKDEIDFFIRPAAPLAGGTPTLAISASSDGELSLVAHLAQGGALYASTADGRAEGADPALGGFGAPLLLSATAVALDEEAARVSGGTGLVAWLDDAAGAASTRVHVARRDPFTGLWSAAAPILALPAGDITDYEVIYTRAPLPVLYVAAVVSGEVHLVQSLNSGVSFGPSILVSSPGATAFEVEAEGQLDNLALLFTDNRGPLGTRALWSRTGGGLGGALAFGAETLVSAALGGNAAAPELAMEGALLLVGWLEGNGVEDGLFVRTSEDFGASFQAIAEPTAFVPGAAAVDTVSSFDLEITQGLLQVAAAVRFGGVDRIVRYTSNDTTVFFGEEIGEGFRPRYVRQEGIGPDGPDSQTLVYASATARGGVTLLGTSADQAQGSEYHDELVPFGADAGLDPAATVEHFAVAYNRRYDNYVIPFATAGGAAPASLDVTGYRPITLIGEELFPGSTEAHLAIGHVPFEDTFVAALLSFSRGKGSLVLPDGRDTGLALDALTLLGLTEPLFSTSFFTANVPGLEGAEFGDLPFVFPAGLELFAVGLSFGPTGAVRKVGDVIALP